MKTIKWMMLLGSLLVFGTTDVTAQEPVDRKRPALPGGIVEIQNGDGSVEITGWKRREVAVRGTLGTGTDGLEFSGDGYRTTVRVLVPDAPLGPGDKKMDPSHLKVLVPESSQIEAETVDANISVAKVRGRVYLESVGGDIVVRDAPKEVDVRSVRGTIELATARSRVKGHSVEGTLLLKAMGGEADLSNVSGNIVVQGGQLDRGRFKSVSGNIRFEGDLNAGGVFDFSNYSGDVELKLPETFAADFRVSTFNGNVKNAFGPGVKPATGRVRSKRLTFSTGSDIGRLQVEGESKKPPLSIDFGSQPSPNRLERDLFRAPTKAQIREAGRARVSVSTFSGNVRLQKQ